MAEAVTPPAERPDPRTRPDDPAGTRPKVDPESLLPARRDAPIDADAVEDDGHAWLAAGTAPVAALPAAVPADAPAPQARGRHRDRFGFLLGALVAVGVSAVAAAAIFALAGSRGGESGADGWAPWHPTGRDPVAAIAAHVAPEYRLAATGRDHGPGRELVFVTGGKLAIAGLDMQIVVQGHDVRAVGGKGVLYRMCGLGPKCAIAEGKPSVDRYLLLRREALELALYTFRYQPKVDNVVVFPPPPPGKDPTNALLFRRGALRSSLSEPLRATIAGHTPSVTDVGSAPDTPVVEQLTGLSQFSFTLTQANQDNLVAPPGG